MLTAGIFRTETEIQIGRKEGNEEEKERDRGRNEKERKGREGRKERKEERKRKKGDRQISLCSTLISIS